MTMTTSLLRLVPVRGACSETARAAWDFSAKPASGWATKDRHFSVFSIKKWALSAIWRLSRRYNLPFIVTRCAQGAANVAVRKQTVRKRTKARRSDRLA
ncbi:hypothetical protein [Caballeronia sp. LjRoot31]|uniref:hypothetical protein n=1 Tax=Caballeronia sp. LjRoot31 TaxID=3342324 RepID=UPI003F500F5F